MELTHTRLLVDCFKECFIFYRDVMGLEPIWGTEEGRYADFNAGNTTLALFDRKSMAEAINESYSVDDHFNDRTVIVFQVNDVDKSFLELKGKVNFISEPVSRQYGIRSLNFRDPAGNLIELYHEIPME
ncbi:MULTISPECIES: VOC family protein [Paenibacillus]|uniref:Glyoxalase/bleomycin resistance protein/dioxygenase n=3 Tax=Paenibacillus TaxID=44249 RepID=G4HJV5_9BACL|nr:MULTISPECIES: VOC family protein [Paenibacillus]ANY76315.1 bleomycin resistance protein [Paenibacillus ihbetae]EHB62559.1 Glyoxalase/bleomycin resistance protein/dioxygenase [Paenibacillus lactis 154]MBP1896811.1 catechol 2,3-dioxygenase-like lactoylglutathione lyase family enzyme [Paenibacillus lactis]GIO90357.1 extradiol dioxygenase [Paenibacillus lactis]